MLNLSSLSVPENITFEQAIEITQTLLDKIEEKQLFEAEIETVIVQLVTTQNGARGFFVTYLTDPRPFCNQPTDAVIQALQKSPEIVSELLVKNIAMSAAMAVYHRRHNNTEMESSSQRVSQRSSNLIQRLNFPQLRSRVQQLFDSAKTGEGTYQEFLDRWGYDAEQQDVIAEVLQPLL
ncbi:hypothetical protein PCC9214_04366 [Planktothrix tepida]|uniref:Uncharacterized protein n=2 Tax=Planktothrix TaxID=54304 RepID=A0A1J1LTY6_9CYAN|nr:MULTISPECIES: hypothetical protein [Planktothrix]CAD5930800.1 hypothetical protein NO713_01274 [Planktothrix pseudagardhii]CAD5978274.1 hypothetical protein PCC9214_04366 [Planktothrix tepida]CUR36067.1 conserved hypothetical protein [Planktothrix tepida PCC 9214]